jgi:hypothetical protein
MPFYKQNYHSGMASSPVVNGVAGSGIGWLDSMLISGFNIKAVTSLTRTDTTATATTSTAHGFVIGDIVGFYGVVEAGWNDLYQILTVPDSTHFTFTVPDTLSATTTGTITVKYPPVGAYVSSGNIDTYWTKVLSGTNQAIYRSLDPQCTQWFLRVDDTNAKYMTVSTLEGYSTFTTGLLNQKDVYWHKSFTADATARPWSFIGDSKRFYPGVTWTNNVAIVAYNTYEWYFFGDMLTVKPGDSYHCVIIGNTNTAPANTEQGTIGYNSFGSCYLANYVGAWMLRGYSQLGPQVNFGKLGLASQNTYPMGSVTAYTHPNPSNSGTFIGQQLFVVEGISPYSIRGKMPGLYPPISNTAHNFANRDTSVVVDGRQYMYFRLSSGSSYLGGFFMDVTPNVPWSL